MHSNSGEQFFFSQLYPAVIAEAILIANERTLVSGYVTFCAFETIGRLCIVAYSSFSRFILAIMDGHRRAGASPARPVKRCFVSQPGNACSFSTRNRDGSVVKSPADCFEKISNTPVAIAIGDHTVNRSSSTFRCVCPSIVRVSRTRRHRFFHLRMQETRARFWSFCTSNLGRDRLSCALR